jgi:hypothetical protein
METPSDTVVGHLADASAGPIPVLLDDGETRRTVRRQEKLENGVLFVCCLYALLSCAWEIFHDHTGVFGAVVLLFVVYLFLSFLYAGLKKLVFRPIRAVRYGRCARRLIARAESLLRPIMLEAWKNPSPGIVALDPIQRLLFVECQRTGYHSFLLRPDQIIDVKVERRQTVETNTRHSGQTIFMPFESFGWLGGGSSRSTATVYETAFLEISFLRSENTGIERVVVNFGGRRQVADDWVLAINRLRDGRL